MDSILTQLAHTRQLFAEAAPTDSKTIADYAWTLVKALLRHAPEMGSKTSRQILAECLKLPLPRPSKLYSALLTAAIKVADNYPEFRFATFLRMWNLEHLLPEDQVRPPARDGKRYQSLAERAAKRLAHSLLLYPEDLTPSAPHPTEHPSGASNFGAFLSTHNYSLMPMIVTRFIERAGKDGRKYRFVTLTSPDGFQVETIAHNLKVSPLHPLPEGKRHYINVRQSYNVLLRYKETAREPYPHATAKPEWTVVQAVLSTQPATTRFAATLGYIEAVDQAHHHLHVYDALSRHFVAPIQRFSRERAGDFVRFIPIVPQASAFKTAIILGTVAESDVLSQQPKTPNDAATVPSASAQTFPSPSKEGEKRPQAPSLIRTIKISSVNAERGYAAWELLDKSQPITERLSPLQVSKGENSPSFTGGYISLSPQRSLGASAPSNAVPTVQPSELRVGQVLRALIFLKRGKDRQKRPYVAKIYPL